MKQIIIQPFEQSEAEVMLPVHKDEEVWYVVYGFADSEKKITISLEGEGAKAHIIGIVFGTSGRCALHTIQHHHVPHTESNLWVKSVVFGDAKFEYTGRIIIEKDAQQSNAYQKNDNLLASPNARVETTPELEILANDVKCSHGATVSRIDDDMLFYLMSRGISQSEAQELFIRGFLLDALAGIPDDERKGMAVKIIGEKVEDMSRIC